MPEWLQNIISPVLSGSVAGLVLVAGLRVEVRNLKESMGNLASSVHRAHVRMDDHIERHHISVRKGQ